MQEINSASVHTSIIPCEEETSGGHFIPTNVPTEF